MSSALKPVLPPGAQTTAPNTVPPKPLPPQGMPHNVPTSYNQPMSHVPQNLGLPHSTNMTANILPNMGSQNTQAHSAAHTGTLIGAHIGAHTGAHSGAHTGAHSGAHTGVHTGAHTGAHTGVHSGMVSQPPLSIPTSHVTSPNKNAGLPASRPNMIPYHPNSSTVPREEEGTTLPPSQNAAQLMAVHRAQEQMSYAKPQSNGTAPAQPEACNKSPTLPAPVEVKPEPPVVPVQNHIPESAKQPAEVPPQVNNQ